MSNDMREFHEKLADLNESWAAQARDDEARERYEQEAQRHRREAARYVPLSAGDVAVMIGVLVLAFALLWVLLT